MPGRDMGKNHQSYKEKMMIGIYETIDWQPTCEHDLEPVPAVVLDPFVGSGTTCMEARKLGRNSIGLDLSYPYLQLARERLGLTALAEWEQGKDGTTKWTIGKIT
jgi:hypothetical protein